MKIKFIVSFCRESKLRQSLLVDLTLKLNKGEIEEEGPKLKGEPPSPKLLDGRGT
jgi:hypothetical protein